MLSNKIFRMGDDGRVIDLLKVILKNKDNGIVYTGSFALYCVKNNLKINDIPSITISDIDVDLLNLVYKFNITGSQINKIDKLELVEGVEQYFSKLLSSLTTYYSNIKSYGVKVSNVKNIKTRGYNSNTLGLILIVSITDKESVTKTIKLDINIESKIFEVEKHNFVIDDEAFSANAYSYNKILADKIIATYKHIEIYFKNTINGVDTKKLMFKLTKDFYDLNFIWSKPYNENIANMYIQTMQRLFNFTIIDKLKTMINKLINVNSPIMQVRGVAESKHHQELIELITQLIKPEFTETS